MDNRYLVKRQGIEEVFARYAKREGADEESLSPSGSYRLSISRYADPNKRAWEYSRGIVTRATDGKVIADVKRNYSDFWHVWVEHPNGNEYLLCGEDYQGYSVVNLTAETYHVYFPEEGYKGRGFCWAAVYPSPDKLMLAVDGCYWACPYDIVFYDFRTPDRLPYQEIGRTDNLWESEGWSDNETFVFTQEVRVRKSDGIPYEQLSDEEQDIIDADDSLVESRNERFELKRPLLDGSPRLES